MPQHGVWTDEQLSALPTEDRFRLRGLSNKRIDAFTDAAFAFALTMLVISFDHEPTSFAELTAPIKNIPAFTASFTQIAMFWYAHHI